MHLLPHNAVMTMNDKEAGRQEFLLIEAARGLAAALVVYTHFWAFSGNDPAWLRFAHTGVDLFFVLSGYVFGPYFFGKSLQALPFWTRRLFRIYPLYLLALSIYFLEKSLQGLPLRYVAEHLSFTYLQSKAMAFYYNPPFWSLPAEVGFYLVLPGVAWGLQHARSMRWLALSLLIAAALAARLMLGFQADYAKENAAYIWLHHLPGLAIEFLIGAALWAWVRRSSQPAAGIGLLGVASWIALAWHFGSVGDSGIQASLLRGQIGLLAALSYAFMLAALLRWYLNHHSPALQAKSLTAAGFEWAGRLSYGTYLFHIAALRAAQAFENLYQIDLPLGPQWTACFLTLAFACLAHKFWEEPLRSLGRRLSQLQIIKTHPYRPL